MRSTSWLDGVVVEMKEVGEEEMLVERVCNRVSQQGLLLVTLMLGSDG